MGMEIVDVEIEQRRQELENDPSAVMSSDKLKSELQKLRDAR